MLLACVAFVLFSPPPPLAAEYRSERINGVPCHIVEASLSVVRVEIVVPPGFPNAEERFSSMVSRSEPFAAINGTYFDVNTFRPIGDIVTGGTKLYDGRMGTVLAITTDDRADIRRVPWGRTQNWRGYSTVLGCGPALLLDGVIDIDPEGERFQSRKVTMRTPRSGVGITLGDRIILLQTRSSVDLDELAEIFKALGCHEAMNLDAGASLAFHADGKTYQRPSRKLTNILVLYDESANGLLERAARASSSAGRAGRSAR